MKKILIALLGMLLVMGALSACNSAPSGDFSSDLQSESSEEVKEYCTLTFKQEGQPDIVKQVEKDSSFNEEWPVPVAKVGYNVEWSHQGTDTDWGHITVDHVFIAVATPKEYRIVYDVGDFATLPDDTSLYETVTYDSEATFPVPTREGWEFIGWKYNGEIVNEGKWQIDSDGEIRFEAEWRDVRSEFTITFRQEGQEDVVFKIKQYDSFPKENVPDVVPVTGYIIEWDLFWPSIEYVRENVVINADITPKLYTFHYDAEGYDIDGDFVQVYYDSEFSQLDMSLTQETYKLVGWEDEDGNVYTNKTVWTRDLEFREEPRYLTPVWVEKQQVKITFVHADGSTETLEKLEGDSIRDLELPINKDCVGYRIINYGWYIDKECTQKALFNNITQDMKVYTRAKAKTYDVYFNAGAGASVGCANMQVEYAAKYYFPIPTHSLDYMEFVCWRDSNGEKVDATGVWLRDNGETLTAEWRDTREQ